MGPIGGCYPGLFRDIATRCQRVGPVMSVWIESNDDSWPGPCQCSEVEMRNRNSGLQIPLGASEQWFSRLTQLLSDRGIIPVKGLIYSYGKYCDSLGEKSVWRRIVSSWRFQICADWESVSSDYFTDWDIYIISSDCLSGYYRENHSWESFRSKHGGRCLSCLEILMSWLRIFPYLQDDTHL